LRGGKPGSEPNTVKTSRKTHGQVFSAGTPAFEGGNFDGKASPMLAYFRKTNTPVLMLRHSGPMPSTMVPMYAE
jgi:hypothetical protein